MIHCSLNQIQGPHDVVLPVKTRLPDALAYLAKCCKVQHRSWGVLFANSIHIGLVKEIASLEWAKFNSVLPASDQIIERHGHISRTASH